MKIHYLQHHPCFPIGSIRQWAVDNGHTITGSDLSKKDLLPNLEDFDLLVPLGGPMGAYEEGRHLWIKMEREFIGEAIVAGKHILSFGIGAQIVSQALRGDINKNPYREICFGEVRLNKEGREFPLLAGVPEKFTALHWHKDILEVPRDGHLLAKSKGCKTQAFRYKDRVMCFQFHLETTAETILDLIKQCRGDIVKGQFVQSPEELEHNSRKCKNMNAQLDHILQNYATQISELNAKN